MSIDLQLEQARIGRQEWLGLAELLELQPNDYIILFSSQFNQLNYYALLYLNQFIAHKKPARTFIVTDNDLVMKAHSFFTDKIDGCHKLSSEDIAVILLFYRLYMFTDRLIIVALDELPGRSLGNLVGVNRITLEEIISLGIYQLRKFQPETAIQYDGDEPALLQFFYQQV